MKNLKLTGAVAGLLGILGCAGALVWADSPKGHHHYGEMSHPGMGYEEGHEGMPGHHGSMSPIQMKEELGLSDEQVSKLRPLEKSYRKMLIQNEADVQVAMVDLGTLLDTKSPDKQAIEAKVDDIMAVQKKMMMFRVESLLDIKEVLNPEQYAKFQDRLRKRMEGISHHSGGMQDGLEGHGQYPGKHHGKESGSGTGMPREHP